MADGPVQRVPARIWFVLPTYRDTASFVLLREAVLRQVAEMPQPIERVSFVVVDDTAGSDPEIEQLGELPDVLVVTPPFNLGHQRAIVFGLRTIRSSLAPTDYVVTMDSDGEDRAEDVPKLIDRLRDDEDRLDMVVVARRTKRSEPFTFRALYVGFVLLFRLLTGTTIRSGNFAAQRGHFVRNAIDHPSFDLCYSSSLIKLKREIVYVPCPRGERLAGESRMGLQSLLVHGVRMMLPFADQIAVRSLIVFAGFLGATIVAGVAFLVSALVFDADFGGTLLALLVVGVSLSFLSLGTFLALFSGFAQSSAAGLKGIEVMAPLPSERST
ncbi:MAG: glycosyltransferase [Acidimicrobiia bacterium]|jgi:hypothetical protein